jgi:hypothetical protein
MGAMSFLLDVPIVAELACSGLLQEFRFEQGPDFVE